MPTSNPASPHAVQTNRNPARSRVGYGIAAGRAGTGSNRRSRSRSRFSTWRWRSPNGGYSSELTAGATVAVWWTVVIALALGGWPRSRVPPRRWAPAPASAALAAWTAISIGWASDDGGAFVEVVRALGYLGVFVLVVIASPRASARVLARRLALGLVVVAVLALVSRFEPSFAGDQSLGTFLPAAAGRLSYPIGYWNGLAAAMAIGGPAAGLARGPRPGAVAASGWRWRRSRCRSWSSTSPPRAAA